VRGDKQAGFANVHIEPLLDAHDRRIPRETMQEEPRYATVACVRHGAVEQRAANAAATVSREDREAEFCEIVFEGHMRHANERALIVVNAENCVAAEIDSVDVGSDHSWRKRRGEPQAPVLHGQREKMRHERGAYAFIQALDSDGHHRAFGSIAAE
jgi:hypothetical protein